MSGQKDYKEAQEKTDSPRLSATAMSFNPTIKVNPAQVNTFTPGRLTPSQRPSSAPGLTTSAEAASRTPGQVPTAQGPSHLTSGQHHQFSAGYDPTLSWGSTPYFAPFIPRVPPYLPNFNPPESPSYPIGPAPSADEEPNYNLQGREIAPGLSVGYAAISPEMMQAEVKGKAHAAAITIIDGRVPDSEPVLGNSTNTLKHQSQPWETPQHNFLSLVIRKSNLALMYKLREICDFIDRYYATPPNLVEQQEAARGFDEDDDDIFLGAELLGKTGEDLADYHARHMRPASVVMIHGGQTARCRYQPTFIGIAYLMRKWQLGLKETLEKATRFDGNWSDQKLSLTEVQTEGLEVWHKIQFDIWDRDDDGHAVALKPVYAEYIQKHKVGEEKPNQHDLRASG